MISKEKLIEAIRELPDQFSVEDLFERIIFISKVEAGLEQSKNNQTISTIEARERLKKWLLK